MAAKNTCVIEYLPKQYEFLQNCTDIKYSAYIGGFGSGKTHVLCLQALVEAVKPSLGLIGANTYRLLADTTQRKFFELCPPSWVKRFYKSDQRLELINGSEILFRSLERPEKLTNLNLDWWGLDEIGEVEMETFRMLQARLRKDGGSHRGFGAGNPAGPVHWTYEYFVQKAAIYTDTYSLVQATTYENTFLGRSYGDDLTKSYGKDTLYYKRFVLGEFVAFEGSYWPNFSVQPYPEGHVLTWDQVKLVLNPNTSWHFGKSVDFGYEHNFACLWYVTDGQTIVFIDEHVAQRQTILYHCLKIKEHEAAQMHYFGAYDTTWAHTDHQGQERAEVQNAAVDNDFVGFTCILANKSVPVMTGILLIQTLIEKGRFFICEQCKNARVEIPSYHAVPMNKSGHEKPVKLKDDTCDAVRYACVAELRHTMDIERHVTANEDVVKALYDNYGDTQNGNATQVEQDSGSGGRTTDTYFE